MSVSYFNTVQSFVQFLWNWILGGGQLVDQNTANIRAALCVNCHNNKGSGEVRKKVCCGGGKLANIVVDKARASIIKQNKTVGDARLLVCGICGCDNKISVWIPNNVLLKPEDANAYPGFCWRKAVTEGRDL